MLIFLALSPTARSRTVTLFRLRPNQYTPDKYISDCSFRKQTYPIFYGADLSGRDGRCVRDLRTYSPQHADLRLLAIPAVCL